MSITLIAAVDIEFGIGKNNGDLLFDIKADKKHFANLTTGKHVVMGRNTYESLPDEHRPLKKRKNYVLTSYTKYNEEGVTTLNSINDVLDLAKGREIFVAGGGELYKQLIPFADRLLLTHVHVIEKSAEVFFPEFSILDGWKLNHIKEVKDDDSFPYTYTFAEYKRKR